MIGIMIEAKKIIIATGYSPLSQSSIIPPKIVLPTVEENFEVAKTG
jgi:hypothetical protein